jgi:hypothetical protein
MKPYLKLSLIALAAMPMLGSAQTFLYIYSQADHFSINGEGGGGPFMADVEQGPAKTIINTITVYCDSVPQEFSVGQTFQVTTTQLDSATNTSLDPWVITQANNEAALYDTANSVTLSNKQIVSAIQGVIWGLDGQESTPFTSDDSDTAGFANYLINAANTIGTTNVYGFDRYNAEIDYPNGIGGVNGQSQIGQATPEPSAFLGLGLPVVGLAFKKRRARK